MAILLTSLTSWIVRSQRPLKVDRWFRRLQLFSAALFSLGHGTNDSQKGMGIITAALVSSGLLHTTAGGKLPVPFWVAGASPNLRPLAASLLRLPEG